MFNFEGALLCSRRFYVLPTLEDATEDFLMGDRLKRISGMAFLINFIPTVKDR